MIKHVCFSVSLVYTLLKFTIVFVYTPHALRLIDRYYGIPACKELGCHPSEVEWRAWFVLPILCFPLDIRCLRTECATMMEEEVAQVLKFYRWTRYEINADCKISQRDGSFFRRTLRAFWLRDHVCAQVCTHFRAHAHTHWFLQNIFRMWHHALARIQRDRNSDKRLRTSKTSGLCATNIRMDTLLCYFE